MNFQHTNTMRNIFLFFLLFASTNALVAQKRPLDHSVYDGWQSISTSALSKNGQYIYYVVSPQEGDGQLVVTTPDNQTVGRIDRGNGASFSPDDKFLLALIKPFYAETREARIKRKNRKTCRGIHWLFSTW